jgi:hypothetical protein
MTEVRAQLFHLYVHGIPPWQELMARDVLYISALQLNLYINMQNTVKFWISLTNWGSLVN